MVQVNARHAITQRKPETVANLRRISVGVGRPRRWVRARRSAAIRLNRTLGVVTQPAISRTQLGRNVSPMRSNPATARTETRISSTAESGTTPRASHDQILLQRNGFRLCNGYFSCANLSHFQQRQGHSHRAQTSSRVSVALSPVAGYCVLHTE
jgi:hypothetical protein